MLYPKQLSYSSNADGIPRIRSLTFNQELQICLETLDCNYVPTAIPSALSEFDGVSEAGPYLRNDLFKSSSIDKSQLIWKLSKAPNEFAINKRDDLDK